MLVILTILKEVIHIQILIIMVGKINIIFSIRKTLPSLKLTLPNLKNLIENSVRIQKKYNEEFKNQNQQHTNEILRQLTSKVDLVATYNRMLET